MGKAKRTQKAQRQDDSKVRMNFLFQAAHVVPQDSETPRALIDTMRHIGTRSVSSMFGFWLVLPMY